MLFAGFAIALLVVASLQTSLFVIIAIAGDALFILLWLISCGINAHLRSILDVPIDCTVYNDGSLINSNHCVKKRTNPDLVVGKTGLAIISAVAGLSALEL
jgi:hypothetical protein